MGLGASRGVSDGRTVAYLATNDARPCICKQTRTNAASFVSLVAIGHITCQLDSVPRPSD